jgi:hypothetical protein
VPGERGPQDDRIGEQPLKGFAAERLKGRIAGRQEGPSLRRVPLGGELIQKPGAQQRCLQRIELAGRTELFDHGLSRREGRQSTENED